MHVHAASALGGPVSQSGPTAKLEIASGSHAAPLISQPATTMCYTLHGDVHALCIQMILCLGVLGACLGVLGGCLGGVSWCLGGVS